MPNRFVYHPDDLPLTWQIALNDNTREIINERPVRYLEFFRTGWNVPANDPTMPGWHPISRFYYPDNYAYQRLTELGYPEDGSIIRPLPDPANTVEPHVIEWMMGMIPIVGDAMDIGELLDWIADNPHRVAPHNPWNPNKPEKWVRDPWDYPRPDWWPKWLPWPRPGSAPTRTPIDRGVPSFGTPSSHRWFFDPRHWEHYIDCGRWPGAPPYGPGTRPYPDGGMKYYNGDPGGCATLQVPGNFNPAGNIPKGKYRYTGNWPYRVIADYRVSTAGVHRTRHDQNYRRLNPDPREPFYRPYFGNPARLPTPRGNPNPLPRVPRVPRQNPSPEWQWSNTPPGQPNPRRHRREPPRPGVREGKVLSRVGALGVAVFRALDWISESAEVVDAVYDALPADVRRRWGAGRDDRPVLDQFSQFGIDGADWKLQALFHNWHRVDLPEALKNILKNEIEDKIIGAYARASGFRAGWAWSNSVGVRDFDFPAPEEAIARTLKSVYETLGLE